LVACLEVFFVAEEHLLNEFDLCVDFGVVVFVFGVFCLVQFGLFVFVFFGEVSFDVEALLVFFGEVGAPGDGGFEDSPEVFSVSDERSRGLGALEEVVGEACSGGEGSERVRVGASCVFDSVEEVLALSFDLDLVFGVLVGPVVGPAYDVFVELHALQVALALLVYLIFLKLLDALLALFVHASRFDCGHVLPVQLFPALLAFGFFN